MVDRLTELKAFFMKAGEMSSSEGSINVHAIAGELGIDPKHGRGLARHLEKIGWVAVEWTPAHSEVRLWLTERGFQKISDWSRPRWRQLIDEYPLARDAAMMAGTAFMASTLSAIVTYLILKPN